ncbi:MAG: VOC family protein [Ornithinimicrobium sp.]|uniref:VOC family protein n=1 Tax=Ornithinimicrobium sp. TaxID=1977084 RepID=UPI0026E06141|nr:VOC family protein [Ornithinimicrobium sp.]MDO5740218.1 VOC family protein [Ornithinimicrobium sp.]
MPAALDHLVYAVPDLDAAIEEFAMKTGARPVAGGSHPGRGTRNALIGLRWRGSRRCYLELLAPDPEQPDVNPATMMLDLGAVLSTAPRMHTWAIRPGDLDATLARAAQAQVEVGEAVSASRVTPAGTTLSWRLAVPAPLGLAGLQPFLIDWGAGGHPSGDPLPIVELLHLELAHPQPALVGSRLDMLGVGPEIGAELRTEPSPAMTVTLATPSGVVVLT